MRASSSLPSGPAVSVTGGSLDNLLLSAPPSVAADSVAASGASAPTTPPQAELEKFLHPLCSIISSRLLPKLRAVGGAQNFLLAAYPTDVDRQRFANWLDTEFQRSPSVSYIEDSPLPRVGTSFATRNDVRTAM
jgi:hypothetical protein